MVIKSMDCAEDYELFDFEGNLTFYGKQTFWKQMDSEFKAQDTKNWNTINKTQPETIQNCYQIRENYGEENQRSLNTVDIWGEAGKIENRRDRKPINR